MHFRIFEFWRLAAAISIMCWHFLRFAPPGHEAVSAFLYRLLPLMEMFFMISGFLIMMRYAEVLTVERGAWRRFIIRRLARFYPLYLATLLFFVAVALAVEAGLVHTDSPGRYDLGLLIHNLVLVQAWGLTESLTFNYVAWSMSAEWFCYLALPAIVLVWRFGGMIGLAGLSALLIVTLEIAVATGVMPFPSWLQADTWGAYRALADFALGGLVAMAARESRLMLTSHLPAWVAFAVSIAAMASLAPPYLVVGLLALSMFLAAVAERNNPDGSRFLEPSRPLGQVSLGIYLIHPVVEAVLLAVVWRRFLEPLGIVGFYVYWFVPIAAVLVLALLSMRYFETPVANWLNRFGQAGRRNPAALAPAE